MLRKLFGLQAAPSARQVGTGSPAAPARAPGVPHRRKSAFEALENRLLLSADPLGVVENGVLALGGGDIIAVTLGEVTQRYGDEFFGIVRLDTGAVETVTFSSFEHLAGGDESRDTFVFSVGAGVSGSVDGGAGAFDSIVIQGREYERITYTAAGPDSGTIALDDRGFAAARDVSGGAGRDRIDFDGTVSTGAATLEAGGDIEVDVANAVELTAAQAAVATIAIETAALVEGGATLVAQDMRLHAASELASRGEEAIDLGRSAAFAPTDGDVRAIADALAGALAADDRRATVPIDLALGTEPGFGDEGFTADPRTVATGRPLPDTGERAAAVAEAGPGERLEQAIARELARWEPIDLAEALQPGAARPLAGALIAASAIAGRSDAPLLAPAAEADADASSRRAAERDDDGDDGGLGASLVLSVLKDSAFAELARNVTTGGGTVVLAAAGTPFARGRARGGPEAIDAELVGALELREADVGGAVVVAESADATGEVALVGAGELVLATAARHDLVAEADGGADRGTAVTPATAIDFSTPEAPVEAGARETFTLAAPADAGDTPVDDAPAGGLAGLALSTDLPPLAFEHRVGGDASAADAIRSTDEAGVPVTAGAIAVSGLLDPAPVALPADTGSEHDISDLVRCLDAEVVDGRVVNRRDEASICDSREVVIAYLGALFAPMAASTGLIRDGRYREGGDRAERRRRSAPRASGHAGRAPFGADAIRAGGAWAERFVNDLGQAPEDVNPNAKIKLKL
jgi:hypothetical protein